MVTLNATNSQPSRECSAVRGSGWRMISDFNAQSWPFEIMRPPPNWQPGWCFGLGSHLSQDTSQESPSSNQAELAQAQPLRFTKPPSHWQVLWANFVQLSQVTLVHLVHRVHLLELLHFGLQLQKSALQLSDAICDSLSRGSVPFTRIMRGCPFCTSCIQDAIQLVSHASGVRTLCLRLVIVAATALNSSPEHRNQHGRVMQYDAINSGLANPKAHVLSRRLESHSGLKPPSPRFVRHQSCTRRRLPARPGTYTSNNPKLREKSKGDVATPPPPRDLAADFRSYRPAVHQARI